MQRERGGTWEKVFVWLAAAIAAVNLFDFLSGGREARDLVAAIGFALLAAGAFQRAYGRPGGERGERIGRLATTTGLALALIGIVMGFMGWEP